MIKSSDMDFIISITLFPDLGVQELCLDFGTGQKRVFYPAHTIFVCIGIDRATGLLFSMHLLVATNYPSLLTVARQLHE